jgi:hypothetical protein
MVKFDLIDINKEIYDACVLLKKGAKMIFTYAEKAAAAERDYRKEFAIVSMRLKGEGKPATLIENLTRGELSELRYKRDLAEYQWNACRESLKAQESQINALQSILKYQTEIEGRAS